MKETVGLADEGVLGREDEDVEGRDDGEGREADDLVGELLHDGPQRQRPRTQARRAEAEDELQAGDLEQEEAHQQQVVDVVVDEVGG